MLHLIMISRCLIIYDIKRFFVGYSKLKQNFYIQFGILLKILEVCNVLNNLLDFKQNKGYIKISDFYLF